MRPLFGIVFATLLASSASAQLLYHTGFESSNYVVGQSIDGIDGWFSFLSPDAPEIKKGTSTASWGRRALKCWGGSPDLQVTQGLLDGAWAQTLALNPCFPWNTKVRVQCDVRLDGPDTGAGPQHDLLSANLYARNGNGGSAYMYMSSTGDVYCFADSAGGSAGYAFATPITLGLYATLAITLDYSTHMATFSVDHCPIGSLPFGGQPGESFRGTTLEFAAYDDPTVIDPALYTGYWDNLFVVAYPFWW